MTAYFKLFFYIAIYNSVYNHLNLTQASADNILLDKVLDNIDQHFLRTGNVKQTNTTTSKINHFLYFNPIKRQLFPSDRLRDLDQDVTIDREPVRSDGNERIPEGDSVIALGENNDNTLNNQISDNTEIGPSEQLPNQNQEATDERVSVEDNIIEPDNNDSPPSQHGYLENILGIIKLTIAISAPISLFCCLCCITKSFPEFFDNVTPLRPTMDPTPDEIRGFATLITRSTYSNYRSLEEGFTQSFQYNVRNTQHLELEDSVFDPNYRDEHGYIPNAP